MPTLFPAWTLVLLSATSTFAVQNSMIRHFVESSSAAVLSRSSRRPPFLNAAAFISRPSSKKQQQNAILDGSIRIFPSPFAATACNNLSTVGHHGIFHNSNNNMGASSTYYSRLNSSFATVEATDEVAYNNPVEEAEGSNNIITHNLNDAQKEATLRPRYSITRVIAGPGAGKTKVLTCRIAHLLLDTSHYSNDDDNDNDDYGRIGRRGNNDEGILAVTFTKKAAMEMERRLIELLSEATATTIMDDASSSSSSSSSEISTGEMMMEEGEYVQYGNADPNENDVNDSSRQLARRTTVGTFHSVCSKILRKFSKELGDLPSVRNCLGVTKNAAGATISQGEVQTEDDDMASEEEEEEGNGGSRVLVQTLDGSFNILDQSDQLRLLKEVLQKHNIQLKSPASGSSSGGGSNDIRPITVLNAISLLNTRDAMSSTTPTSRGGENDEEDDVQKKVSKKVYRIAMEIRVPFQRAKYSQNSIDFDDLILLARELLLHHSSVREILHRRWRHVLVDEFQDTSRVQLDLVRLLTTNSLFSVGDGDQSIYSWRGASPESMSDFEVAFHDRRHGWEGLLRGGNGSHHHPNHLDDDGSLSRYLERIGVAGGLEDSKLLKVKSVYLMENYRSTTNIVKAAQRIISTSSSEKKFNKENPTSAQDDIRRDMKPMRGAGPSPRVLACKDARAEASFVVKTVNSMVDGGDLTPSSTVAMIYRTNAQSRLLEEACVKHNLRYVVRGSSGTFYKRAEIQDCMSFLKVVYNPRDRSAWARAVKAPSRGIGGASLAEFFKYCDAVTEMYLETASGGGAMEDVPSPMDVLMSLAAPPNDNAIGTLLPPREIMSTRSLNRFVPFAVSFNSLMKKAEVQGVPDFLLSLIEDLGLKGHFDAISKTRDEYEDRLGNVMELVRAAERYKDDGPCITSGPSAGEDESMETPLGNFLDDVALIADLAPDESEAEGGGRIVANLMTIHSSKGMEFDAVFLVGNEDGTLPTQKSIAEGEGSIELSEERRLCYVAMTRAKTHLVLTWRREVAYFAGATFRTRDAIRSRFLDILVSKQKGKSSQDGVQKPSMKGGSNRSPSARKGNFKSAQLSGTMSKRELHSEADRYLNSSAGKSWDNWDPTSRKKPIAKRELHNEANRVSSPGSKSWDDWEPTSQKKPIVKVPSIESNTPSRGVDRRQVTPSTRLQNRPMQSSDDIRQVMPSSRTQLNSNGSRIPASSLTDNRSIDRRRIEPSRRTVAKERSVGKRPNQMSPRESRSQDNNVYSLRGEPPPEMDSTIFFPVGSPVKHNLHGRGIVQTPPNADEQFAEKMLVRVKFSEENMEWDLPMDGLLHTFD